MDKIDKLKALERWQIDSNTKKFKCISDENHEVLKPFIKREEVLMKCLTCGRIFKNLNERVFELGRMLILQDKRNRRR